MSQIEVKLPKWGLTMEEGMISEWLVSVGEQVEEGQILANVEIEKAMAELEAPVSGVLESILVPIELEIPVGTVLCLIDTK